MSMRRLVKEYLLLDVPRVAYFGLEIYSFFSESQNELGKQGWHSQAIVIN